MSTVRTIVVRGLMTEIREAHSHEIQTVRDLFLEYAKSLNFSLCFQDFDQELETLPGAYVAPKGFILLAFQNSKPIGCVALRFLEAGVSEMKRLYVKPDSQGLGIGRALTEELMQKAKKIGYKKIRLDTVPSMKAAINMYAAMGFYSIPAYRENPIEGTTYLEKVIS